MPFWFRSSDVPLHVVFSLGLFHLSFRFLSNWCLLFRFVFLPSFHSKSSPFVLPRYRAFGAPLALAPWYSIPSVVGCPGLRGLPAKLYCNTK